MFLYVIGDGNAVKLGFSKNPTRRLKQLQTGHPTLLELHYTEAFNPLKIKLYEKALHRQLRYLRLEGEWFKVTPEQAIDHVKHLKIYYEEQEYLLSH